MSLVVFRSKAAGEIFMFAETARRIFEIIGKAEAPRGVITAEQVPKALARLQAAVDEERTQLKAAADHAQDADRRGEDAAGLRAITLAQRAFPLLEMLRAAQKKTVDITWGV
jgi:light-regulated signal transduction histidine kinase (bacteriophytochrome)